MAEKDGGIHPDVMHHIIDLHRKVSELQLAKHDRESQDDEGSSAEPHEIFHQMLGELKKLNENLEKLIPAVKADAAADSSEGQEDDDEDHEVHEDHIE